jgi:hypothetical protein
VTLVRSDTNDVRMLVRILIAGPAVARPALPSPMRSTGRTARSGQRGERNARPLAAAGRTGGAVTAVQARGHPARRANVEAVPIEARMVSFAALEAGAIAAANLFHATDTARATDPAAAREGAARGRHGVPMCPGSMTIERLFRGLPGPGDSVREARS